MRRFGYFDMSLDKRSHLVRLRPEPLPEGGGWFLTRLVVRGRYWRPARTRSLNLYLYGTRSGGPARAKNRGGAGGLGSQDGLARPK